MNRRKILSFALPVLFANMAKANNDVVGMPTPFGIPRKAWVESPEIIRQNCQQWCWAASIAMIFARHGYIVPQEEIVAQTFGGLLCMGAPNTLTIARNLSRPWVDINGNAFNSSVSAAYDPANGILNLNNYFMINELSNNNPLLYCNSHHAMVLVVADYLDTPMGPNLQAAAVLDPWPGSPEWHYLSPRELTPVHLGGEMHFLATVSVT